MITSSNGNIFRSSVASEFRSQRPVTRSFDVFFDLHLNKRLSKQSIPRWFEMPSRSLWRHCNEGLHVVAPSPYEYQCWYNVTISWVPWHLHEGDFAGRGQDITEIYVKATLLKITSISPWDKWVKMYVHIVCLTYPPLVPHICASDNGLSPVRCQAITWTNAGLLSIGLMWTDFNEIWIWILSFSFKKMHLKLSSARMAAILSRGRCVKIIITSQHLTGVSELINTGHTTCYIKTQSN